MYLCIYIALDVTTRGSEEPLKVEFEFEPASRDNGRHYAAINYHLALR